MLRFVSPFVAVLALLIFVGCSSSPEEAPEPTPSPTAAAPTATARPTEAPPTATPLPTETPTPEPRTAAPTETPLPQPTPILPAALAPTATPVPPPPASPTPAPISTGVQRITVRAGEGETAYYFNPSQITLRPGPVEITFINEGPVRQHTFNVKNLDYRGELFNSPTLEAGQRATLQFTVPSAGSYVFFCILYGHQNKGQEGVITVR